MMSEKYVTLFCYWGGNVTSTDEGFSYDRDYEDSIRVVSTISYEQLIVQLCNMLGLEQTRVKLNATYRYPVVLGTTVRYRPFRVKNENGVRGMMDAVDQLKLAHVDLYLDYQEMSVDSPRRRPSLRNVHTTPLRFNSEGDHASNSHDLQQPNSPVHAQFPEWAAVEELAEHEDQIGNVASDVPQTLEDIMAEEDSLFGLDVDDSVNVECNDHVDINDALVANEGADEGEEELHQPASQLFTTLSETSTAASSTSRFNCLHWEPQTDEPRVGVLFKDKTELIRALKTYSVRTNTQFKTLESDTRRWAIKCKMSDETPCSWQLRATKLKKHGQFEITKYNGPHSCVYARMNQDHAQLDAAYVGLHIQELVKKDPSVSATFLALVVKNQFQYVISYEVEINGKVFQGIIFLPKLRQQLNFNYNFMICTLRLCITVANLDGRLSTNYALAIALASSAHSQVGLSNELVEMGGQPEFDQATSCVKYGLDLNGLGWTC